MTSFRKLFAFIALAALTLPSLLAQDVAITRIIYPVANQRVHLQFDYEIEFTLKNTGTTNVLVSGVSFELSFDGILNQIYNGPSTLLKPGDSIDVTIPAVTFATPNETMDVCVRAILNNDKDPSNDEACQTVRFSLDNTTFDMAPVKVRIIEPEQANDTVVQVGSQIIRMEVWIENKGDVTIPRNETINLDFSMKGLTRKFLSVIPNPFDTGTVEPVNLVWNFPSVQENAGVFSVCVKLNSQDDVVPSNDEYCQKFFAIDFASVEEKDAFQLTSFANKKMVVVKGTSNEPLNIELYNAVGQIMKQSWVNGISNSHQLDCNELNTGLYIIKISDQSGTSLHSNRIILE